MSSGYQAVKYFNAVSKYSSLHEEQLEEGDISSGTMWKCFLDSELSSWELCICRHIKFTSTNPIGTKYAADVKMAGQQFSHFFFVRRCFCVFVSCQPNNSASITAPPAVQLSLQPLNGLLHWPVLLLFLLVLLLPLLRCELQVHWYSISNGLGSNWRDAGRTRERVGKRGRKGYGVRVRGKGTEKSKRKKAWENSRE